MKVTIVGAGVVGLVCAVELSERGVEVEVIERSDSLGEAACSWRAGGMLAPWCEQESSEPLVKRLGEAAIPWWRKNFPDTVQNGTLVIAHGRDVVELSEFAGRSDGYVRLNRAQLEALEPDLAGRFEQALFYEREAHLDPRGALRGLVERLSLRGVPVRFGVKVDHEQIRSMRAKGRAVVNCSGLAARDVLTDLRGVKGEMALIRLREISLRRPVRVLHPRIPIYIVPRGDGLFMVGATMIESDDEGRVSVRSLLELLTAAYALNPAFGEAEVVELATGIRPAFLDNLPRIRWRDGVLHVNGFFRHGFLLAPALARMATEVLLDDRPLPESMKPEVMDEDHREWLRA
jgi:glycine oxidase